MVGEFLAYYLPESVVVLFLYQVGQLVEDYVFKKLVRKVFHQGVERQVAVGAH